MFFQSNRISFWSRHRNLLWLPRTSEPIYRIGWNVAGIILRLNCFIANNNINISWESLRDNCLKHVLLNISRSSPRIELAPRGSKLKFFFPSWFFLSVSILVDQKSGKRQRKFLQTGMGEMGISRGGKWKFLLGKFPKTKISPRNNSNLKKNEQKRLFFPRFPTRENRISPDWLGGKCNSPRGEIQFLQARNSDVAGRNSGTSRIPPRKSNFPLGEIPKLWICPEKRKRPCSKKKAWKKIG